MSARNTILHDKNEDELYPLTFMGNIYNSSGTERLDLKLEDIADDITDKTTTANVAAIEATTTATAAHAKGSYVYIKSVDSMYRVTNAISAGNTMAVGTNIVKTTVGDELSTLNSDLADLTAYVEVTANGSETYAQLLQRLFAALDRSKVTPKSCLYVTGLQSVYQMTNILSNGYVMGNVSMTNSLPSVSTAMMLTNSAYIAAYSNNAATDYSAITASGRVVLYY